MPRRRRAAPAILTLGLILIASNRAAGTGEGERSSAPWAGVPVTARDRENPYARTPGAVLAGKKLYTKHCESCHGGDAAGTSRAPSLVSDAVRRAAPGEIEWLLRNGSMGRGMPSWSALPEQRRWQLVTYLLSLDGG